MLERYVKKILTARVYDVARETPLDLMEQLSRRLDNRVWVKREDLQPVFSFKLRGAYNKIAGLDAAQRRAGVIASSAGNHAQGVALAAAKLGLRAIIVMPKTTPAIKVNAVRNRGAEVVLHGDAYDDAYQHARELEQAQGLTFIPPFDDPDIIAGQGAIGQEILRQHPEPLDAIFVPVGGGGLIAGISAYVKYLRPDIKIIGVEPTDAPTLHTALAQGRRVILPEVGLFADGVAVRQIGAETFKICQQTVDEVILVTADEMCAAIKDIYEDTRSVCEPAGALGVAGLKAYAQREGRSQTSLLAVNSGANVNFDRLRHVAERAELGERREMLLAVTIPERPGSFKEFCRAIGRRGVTEFNYRYADAAQAHIFVGVQLHEGEAERIALVAKLEERGYPVTDLTDNEMAKLHIRHMVGGRARVADERLLRFEFPERPGALLKFLTHMAAGWNISLFHYRNHGADYGRVLVGIQIPDGDRAKFETFLGELGYRFEDESDNPAYRLFL